MTLVLLIDDAVDSRDAFAWFLSDKGYRTLTASDGLEGVAAAHDAKPDVVVLDLSLPGIDGWEATRRLKSDPATRHIPIIVLSAHVMLADRNKSLAAGADDFDCKPVVFDQLLHKIERLLPPAESQP